MEKLILPLTIAVLGCAAFTDTASAQRIVVESPVARALVGGPRDGRLANDLARLNAEVRQVRYEIRTSGIRGRRIRYDFDRVTRATERLNYEFERRLSDRFVLRRRIGQVRAELYRIRMELRERTSGPRGWR